MIDFVIKYWVEFLFTTIVGILTYFIKRYVSLAEKDRKTQQDKFYESLEKKLLEQYERSQADDAVLERHIDQVRGEVTSIKQGLLSVQGRDFRDECHRLLKDNHIITLEEYEQFEADHDAYHALGGNHSGDHLYQLVKKKMEDSLFD